MSAGHILLVDQLDGDCVERLKAELSRTGVQLALAVRQRHRLVHLGICSISDAQRDGKIAQVQVPNSTQSKLSDAARSSLQ